MKRLLASLLVLSVVVTVFTACGKKNNADSTEQENVTQTNVNGIPTDNTEFDAEYGQFVIDGQTFTLADGITMKQFAAKIGVELDDNLDPDFGSNYNVHIEYDSDRGDDLSANEAVVDGISESVVTRISSNNGDVQRNAQEGKVEFPGGLKTGMDFNADMLDKIDADYNIRVIDKNTDETKEANSIQEALESDYKQIDIVFGKWNENDKWFALNASYYTITIADGIIANLHLYRDAFSSND